MYYYYYYYYSLGPKILTSPELCLNSTLSFSWHFYPKRPTVRNQWGQYVWTKDAVVSFDHKHESTCQAKREESSELHSGKVIRELCLLAKHSFCHNGAECECNTDPAAKFSDQSHAPRTRPWGNSVTWATDSFPARSRQTTTLPAESHGLRFPFTCMFLLLYSSPLESSCCGDVWEASKMSQPVEYCHWRWFWSVGSLWYVSD